MERGKEFHPGDLDKNGKLIKQGDYPTVIFEALPQVQMDLPQLPFGSRTGSLRRSDEQGDQCLRWMWSRRYFIVNANVCAEAEARKSLTERVAQQRFDPIKVSRN